ncbi:MAG: ArsA-related P-loop ATPase [Acidimicrobiia bacterium]
MTPDRAIHRLKELNEDTSLNIVMGAPVTFVTGKGGVGKTTIATLLSKFAHMHGERVLFISLYRDAQTDELLGITEEMAKEDIFRCKNFGFDVSIITPSSALTNYLSSKHMGSITSKLANSGLLDMVANIVPGMRELLVIGDIRSKAQSGKWDRIIVDSPSTGHARSLFNIAQHSSAATKSGVIKNQSEAAQEFLSDQKMTQVLVVTLDHVMPLSECKEFLFDLEDDLHMKIAGVIINKTLVLNSHRSIGIDKHLNNIFVPLYAYPPENYAPKKHSIFKINKHKKLDSSISETININQQINAVVVLGTGGVGKTTCAASIALRAAKQNKKVALLTIDPARRLGTALGFKDTALNESHLDPHTMKKVEFSKALFHVYQLDSRTEFLSLLERTLNETDYKNAKENSFVTSVSKMGIVNEFMAIEAMHRLVTSTLYDLVVVDTPPSHHVYDLFEAPNALKRMTSSNIFKTLVGAGTMASITTNVAIKTIFRPLKGLLGTELVTDAVDFMRTLKDVEEVFTQHSEEIVQYLASKDTKYCVIANPSNSSRDQALSLIKGMFERNYQDSIMVINGVEPQNDIEIESLNEFSSKLARYESKIAVIPEQEFDEPLEIVESISEKVEFIP